MVRSTSRSRALIVYWNIGPTIQTGSVKDLSYQRAVSFVVVRLAQVWEIRIKNSYELGILFIHKQGNIISTF